jgi:hypothetical protein
MPTSGMFDSLSGYPQWLVVTCEVILGMVFLWVLVKLIKLALWLLLFALVATAVLGAIWYILG